MSRSFCRLATARPLLGAGWDEGCLPAAFLCLQRPGCFSALRCPPLRASKARHCEGRPGRTRAAGATPEQAPAGAKLPPALRTSHAPHAIPLSDHRARAAAHHRAGHRSALLRITRRAAGACCAAAHCAHTCRASCTRLAAAARTHLARTQLPSAPAPWRFPCLLLHHTHFATPWDLSPLSLAGTVSWQVGRAIC